MAKAIYAILAVVALLLSACTTNQRTTQIEEGAAVAASSAQRQEGLRLVGLRRFETARSTLTPLLKANPTDSEVKLALAECALGVGRLDHAEPLFASLTNDPVFGTEALQGLGLTLLRRGDAVGAAAVLKTATNRDPVLWRAWSGLAQAHALLGEWNASGEAYDAALRAAPNAGIVLNNIGLSLLAQGRVDGALKVFEKARSADPELSIVETNRRLALAMLQRRPAASFAKAREEKIELLNSAGYIALMKGDYDDAERLFVEAAETSPTYYAPAFENLEALERIRRRSALVAL